MLSDAKPFAPGQTTWEKSPHQRPCIMRMSEVDCVIQWGCDLGSLIWIKAVVIAQLLHKGVPAPSLDVEGMLPGGKESDRKNSNEAIFKS